MFEGNLKSIFNPTDQTIFEAPKRDTPAPAFSLDLNLSEEAPILPPKPPKEGGRVTVRMSRKAKAKLLQLHAKNGKLKQVIFRELLDASPLEFKQEELGGHDSKASFNVVLSAEQLRRLEEARARYEVPLCALISALLLNKKAKND
jgi:hypothetical protein